MNVNTNPQTLSSLPSKRLQFLDEIVGHFNSKNRAYNQVKCICSYSHAVNGGCAIGRKCPPEIAEQMEELSAQNDFGLLVGKPVIFSLLPQELKDLGVDFLQECQLLHDFAAYWNDAGLSPNGQEKYEEIKSEFCEQKLK